jgi:hypothetical protein
MLDNINIKGADDVEDFQVVFEMENGESRQYQFNHTDEQEIVQEFENSSVWLEIPHNDEIHYIQTDKVKRIKIVSKKREQLRS